MSLIEFRDVTFVHQNGVTALSDVSLGVEKQELVGIVGENGAGKTTLVKHINGLLKPTTGSVSVNGKNTRDVSTATLAREVGIAFQNPDHQLFSESVENEITYALKNFGFDSGVIQRRLDWALGFFGLEEYRKSSPLILSGGRRSASPSPPYWPGTPPSSSWTSRRWARTPSRRRSSPGSSGCSTRLRRRSSLSRTTSSSSGGSSRGSS